MKNSDHNPNAIQLIIQEAESILDEKALLELFTKRVEEMMRSDLDLLLSSLYRLDVEEHKIQKALKSSSVPAAEGIAQLIIDRQKEKMETRKKYSSGKSDPWKGLE